MKFLNKFKSKIKNDGGATHTIEVLILLPLLIFFMITIIDVGFFLSNRYIISNATQEGARLVAIYGGEASNAISQKYGYSNTRPSNVVKNMIAGQQNSLVGVTVVSVTCTPNKTTAVGQVVSCTTVYKNNSLPGSQVFPFRPTGNISVTMSTVAEVKAP